MHNNIFFTTIAYFNELYSILLSDTWVYSDTTPIGSLEPSISLLEDRGRILENTIHLGYNYLSILTYFLKIICKLPISSLASLL